MKRRSLLLFALLAIFSFFSCDDDDEDSSFERNLLVNKPWIIAQLVTQRNDGPEEDRYPQLADCQKDDELIFFEHGRYEMNPGEKDCDIEIRETGTWELYGNQLFLANTEVRLVELSETRLKIQHVSTQGGGRETINVTYRVK